MKTDTQSTLIKGIGQVDLRVTDIENALAFYRDVVGLEVDHRDARRVSLRASGGPVVLSLRSDGVDSRADRSASGLYHTAIRFPNRRALANVLQRLVRAGHRIGASDHGISEALYVDDPDGNGIELYRDRPREEWPPPEEGQRLPAMAAPLDLRGLLDDSDDGSGGDAEPGTDVGHVHLQVSDIDRTISFYVDALGLDLMARMGDHAGFFSSGGYHHHLGANTWHSQGRPLASPDHAGLDRIHFVVTDEGEPERARARLEEHGHVVTGELSAIVVHDPDGIELRFVSAESRLS